MLVVSVTADLFVNKPGRPIFDELRRLEMVKSLKVVDDALIVTGLLDALKKVKPDIVVKGRDYEKLEDEHEAYCREHGIEVRFTNTPKYSTTDLIHELGRR